MLSKSVTELAFCFADVLHITFIALDHVNEIGRGTGNVVADALLFIGGEVYDLVLSVTKGRVSHLLLLQRKAPGVFLSFWGGGGVVGYIFLGRGGREIGGGGSLKQCQSFPA